MKALLQRFRAEILLVVLTVAGSLLVYLPFWNEMGTVYRAWDGPNYLTIAKTGYDVPDDYALLGYVYVESYYLRHFPVYPALIRAFSFVGWQRSMLLVSILCAAGAAILFYRLCRDEWKLPQPLWLATVFLFFPPRWLYFRSTGSTEAPFLLFTLAAIWLFERKRVGWASVAGALATLTRIPGILIPAAFGLILLQRRQWRSLPWLLIPAAALAGFFGYCFTRTGNFFEYFVQQGDKAGAFQPFGFMPHLFKLGLYHQVEYFILLAFVYGVGISRIRKHETIFVYSALQFLLHINMSTEEWPRYWLVMAPFALVVGFHEIWEKRETKWLFAIPVLMGFVYCWNAIPLNGVLPFYWKVALAQLGLFGEWTPP
jgi:hypothetical protein